MVRQLNVRVGDITFLLFETILEDLKKEGLEYNQRELIEMMILRTYAEIQPSKRAGRSIREVLET